MTSRVHTLGHKDLTWQFVESNTNAGYEIQLGDRHYRRTFYVDAFPGYPHDEALVRNMLLTTVEPTFPLPKPFAPSVYLLSHESVSRTNGQAHHERMYNAEWNEDDESQRPWRSAIILSGKRIPPHPAMTRYLVGHEYGHVVEDWLIRTRHERESSNDLLLEYAEARGLGPSGFTIRADGGRWHRAIQEIFACDFRLLVAGVEPEFWPHPGVARPEDVPSIQAFWQRVTAERLKGVALKCQEPGFRFDDGGRVEEKVWTPPEPKVEAA